MGRRTEKGAYGAGGREAWVLTRLHSVAWGSHSLSASALSRHLLCAWTLYMGDGLLPSYKRTQSLRAQDYFVQSSDCTIGETESQGESHPLKGPQWLGHPQKSGHHAGWPAKSSLTHPDHGLPAS